MIHGAGAEFRHSGNAGPWERAVIAWGGVLAQGVSLLAVIAAAELGWLPGCSAAAAACVSDSPFAIAIGGYNLFMIGVNLLPIRPLDGGEAWSVFTIVYQRVRKRVILTRMARAHRKSRPSLR